MAAIDRALAQQSLSSAAREAHLLASYAMHSIDSRGRRHAEPEHGYRGPFQRDRDRVTHSAAYRRLSDKTQVFMGEMGDYHRTRLTHTLEVASIARTLGRALRLNEDLIEALALAHDIGHPPFGHSGEDALDECLSDVGGFNHNAHALTIVEQLEQRYPDFPGLNLTAEVLGGQRSRIDKSAGGASPLLEVQVVDAADSVAYDTHDADDALELGLLTLEELLQVPLWRKAAARVQRRWSNLAGRRLERAVLHQLIDWQVTDLLGKVQAALEEREIQSVEDVQASPVLVWPSAELAEQKREFEQFLYDRVYRHRQVVNMRDQAKGYLREMFSALVCDPTRLPKFYLARAESVGIARATGDYLACLTDRSAQQRYLNEFRKPGGGLMG